MDYKKINASQLGGTGINKFGLTLILCILHSFTSFAQTINDSINKERIEKTITYLASDKLRGRVDYTKGQLAAADFISNEFANCGLWPLPGFPDYYQPFRKIWGNGSDDEMLIWNGRKLNDSLFMFFGHAVFWRQKNLADFMILRADYPVANEILQNNWRDSTNNILIWINLPAGVSFSEIKSKIIMPRGIPASDILIVAVPDEPKSLKLFNDGKLTDNTLYNVVGILPGKSKLNETIIISAHYDQVDYGLGSKTGIANGANDDASGTTAVLALARYFAMRKDNERTIVFCLFAGDELGLLGSQAFVNYIKPEEIIGVINIEMIGMTNKAGKNAFFITGSKYSNLGSILQKNLEGGTFSIKKERPGETDFFARSDNYPFALKGIPAHSIMCSDDKEPCYHQQCDVVKRIDMGNMTKVIQAIAKGCKSLISGEDTPTRIK